MVWKKMKSSRKVEKNPSKSGKGCKLCMGDIKFKTNIAVVILLPTSGTNWVNWTNVKYSEL